MYRCLNCESHLDINFDMYIQHEILSMRNALRDYWQFSISNYSIISMRCQFVFCNWIIALNNNFLCGMHVPILQNALLGLRHYCKHYIPNSGSDRGLSSSVNIQF